MEFAARNQQANAAAMQCHGYAAPPRAQNAHTALPVDLTARLLIVTVTEPILSVGRAAILQTIVTDEQRRPAPKSARRKAAAWITAIVGSWSEPPPREGLPNRRQGEPRRLDNAVPR